MRDALNLTHEFYGQPSLLVGDVRPTKLIDFENITLRFQVNLRLYLSVSQSTWSLVYSHMSHRSSFLNVDIGLHKGHYFYIKDLDVLAKHWDCVGCQQRSTYHNNYDKNVTEH